jgi:hypothetical protein
MSAAAAEPSSLPLIEDARPERPAAPAWRRFQGWVRDVCVGRTEDDLLGVTTPGAENPSGLILFFIAALSLLAVMATWQLEGDVLRWLLPIAAFAAVFEVATQWLELRVGARLWISLAKVTTYA